MLDIKISPVTGYAITLLTSVIIAYITWGKNDMGDSLSQPIVDLYESPYITAIHYCHTKRYLKNKEKLSICHDAYTKKLHFVAKERKPCISGKSGFINCFNVSEVRNTMKSITKETELVIDYDRWFSGLKKV